MKNIFIAFIILWTLSFQAQNKDEYTLQGELINNLDPGAGCGYFKLATIAEFKIISFSDISYEKNNIGIIIGCPEFYGENFFKKGNIYNLKIQIAKEIGTNKEFDYIIQNNATLKKYNNKYWAALITPKE
jgi:hypothetical protein